MSDTSCTAPEETSFTKWNTEQEVCRGWARDERVSCDSRKHRVEVSTPASGSHTLIEITDVQFNQKLDPDLFTQRYLERGGH